MKRFFWIGLALLAVGAGVAWWLSRGEAPATGIVITVDTLTSDDELPLPLFARLLTAEAAPIEMVPVPDKARTFRAPGAVQGHYDFFNDAGWRYINDGRPIPQLTPGEQPVHISMGRPCSVYVRPSLGGGFFLESIAAVERVEGRGASATYHVVEDAEIITHPEGWISVRLPPDVCRPRARFRLSGWMSGKHPFDPAFVDLAERDVRRPYTRVVHPASVARLRVVLVGGAGAETDGVEIEAALRGLPIKMTDRIHTSGGIGTFPSLGAFMQGLELRVPAWGDDARYSLSIDRWRREGTVFVRAPDAQRDIRVPVLLPADVGIENIAVLESAMDRFALAQLARTPSGCTVRTSPGQQTWIVYAAGKAMAVDVDVQDGGAAVELGALADAVRVHGKLEIARMGYRVRFERQVGDRWVGGHGMEVDARIGTRYEATVPAGRYRIQVVKPGGRLTKPLTMTWEPGTNVELPLDGN